MYGRGQTTAASGDAGWRAGGRLTKFYNGKKIRRAQRPRIGNQHPEEDRFVAQEACQKDIKRTNVAFRKRLNSPKHSEPTGLRLRFQKVDAHSLDAHVSGSPQKAIVINDGSTIPRGRCYRDDKI